MKKQIILTALGAMLLASCADTFEREYTGVDETRPEYAYLKDYKPLKEYADRSKNPNYKVGGALTASEFNNGDRLYSLAKANFDEIVAGNAMKMASCVNDKGAMDFGTVSSFVNKAEEAGLTVYGHTLAWHAQQPAKYLNSLLEDKQIEIDPDAKDEVEDWNLDCSSLGSLSWNGCPANVAIEFGTPDGVKFTNSEKIDPWYSFQYWLVNGISLKSGDEYIIKAKIKNEGAMDLVLNFKLGDWGGGAEKKITVVPGSDDEVKFTVVPTMDSNGIFLQNNDGWVGSYSVKSFSVSHLEAPAVEIDTKIKEFTYLESYGSDAPFPFWPMGSEPPIVNGAIHFVPTGAWSQFFIDNANALDKGDYKLVLRIKGSKETSMKLTAQNGWGSDAQSMDCNVPITTDWADAVLKLNGIEGGNYDFILKPETNDAVIDLAGYTIYKVEKGNSIPLTPEEKKEILTGVMNTWCAGMMNATEGKVKAWDLINEAISGGGNVNGYYDLQHSYAGQAPSDFFWQDYLGSEDYGVIVEKAAREAYANIEGTNPADLKLFINDYNLESDWDQNKKLKSLIYWIGVWESRGAKIDGIGSQMHISYYENPTTLANKKAAIVNMYKLMAATGKLVRVSEFDMDYLDANGNSVPTANLTEAQHKAMAEYWNWNIRAYLENVPAAQQWGFCNWCITDSPTGSGWRPNTPVGLWDLNYNRKHTYAGYADGLQGKDYSNK